MTVKTPAQISFQQGEHQRAISVYQQAIALKPDFFLAYHNLGKALVAEGDFTQALTAYQQAICLQPDTPDLQFECGNLYQRYGFMQEAIACYKAEIRSQPKSAPAYNSLGAALQQWGEMKLSEAAYRRALTLQADWDDYDDRVAELSTRTEAYLQHDNADALPAMMTLAFPLSMPLRKAVAEQLAGHHAKAATALPEPFSAPAELNPARLRIGYVSPDFRIHAVGTLVCSLFQHHRRPEFEIFAYSLVPVIDDCTETIRRGCDHFIDVSCQAPLTIAQRIHADGIHILIDLAGYTAHSCTDVFACKPASVQMQFLGYPGTLGAEFIPYIIADAQLIPEHLAQNYTEEIIYLPRAWVVSPMPIATSIMRRRDFGLPENATVFCCFNGTYKITPEVFALWLRILQQVPGSVLWLLDGGDTVNNRFRPTRRRRAHRS
ncbi:tetratricopeptide repeat protein [Methylobacter sp. G7]|uniref:O-linked N-acetylglucosamine transferase, SPINDLY family protein n=1 Tax=Methylobacter sp. G7 TaxID=3230117 RepID=UPI003D804EC2